MESRVFSFSAFGLALPDLGQGPLWLRPVIKHCLRRQTINVALPLGISAALGLGKVWGPVRGRLDSPKAKSAPWWPQGTRHKTSGGAAAPGRADSEGIREGSGSSAPLGQEGQSEREVTS